MVRAKVTMRIAEYCLILSSLILNSNGLNCKSEGGPKEKELKKIYNICMKQQNKNNNSDNGRDFDQDWRESRRHNQWPQDNNAKNKGNDNNSFRMEEQSENDGNRMENNRHSTENKHKMGRPGRRSKNTDTRMQQRDREDGNERMYSRDGRNEKQNTKSDNRSERNNGVNDRNDFFQNEHLNEYNNNNQYSTQPTRRYKRERRVEVNSGKRSQYNPNSRFSGYEEKYKDDGKNSSESNSTNDDSKACAVHCLLENLQMTDESGMPDRYLVTHTITNNVKDEDLKDFLQESIEDCFHILDNEDSDDKCEFSKNLIMCLSEKGKANCDDWKDDFQF